MLRQVTLAPRNTSYLAAFRLPSLTFPTRNVRFASLAPIRQAITTGQLEEARELATAAVNSDGITGPEERAAIEVALAHIALEQGAFDTARRRAGRSLDLFQGQFAAHRILLIVLAARKDFAAAYLHLANLPLPVEFADWDEEITRADVSIALASWAWQLGEWDQVAEHLLRAYPDGVASMPVDIREDWFRLSLYRGEAGDAADAAEALIYERPVERADELLQTIVQSGWTSEALPLYRAFYERRPDSELLRRRLVGLCIREGQIEEARLLTQPGALRLAA